MNIGQLCKYFILNSELSNTEILEIVKDKFPEAKTSPACIAWYKSDLRKSGLLGPRQSKNNVVLTEEELSELCNK